MRPNGGPRSLPDQIDDRPPRIANLRGSCDNPLSRQLEGRRKMRRRHWAIAALTASTVVLVVAAQVPMTAQARPKPPRPTGRVSKAEYEYWYGTKKDALRAFHLQIAALPGEEQACSNGTPALSPSTWQKEWKAAWEGSWLWIRDYWVPLEKWGSGLSARASQYPTHPKRNLVDLASHEISSGASLMVAAEESLAKADEELEKQNCNVESLGSHASSDEGTGAPALIEGFLNLRRAGLRR